MNIEMIHNELSAYYSGVIALLGNEVVYVTDIYAPRADGFDDEDFPIYDDIPDSLEVMEAIPYFECEVGTVGNTSMSLNHCISNYRRVCMEDIQFIFPEMGLVNIVTDAIEGTSIKFNIAKNVNRVARRQWRRALRADSLTVMNAQPLVRNNIEYVTEKYVHESLDDLTGKIVCQLFNPQYTPIEDALAALTFTVGSYAISPEWWIGQGRHGLEFGYHHNTVGDINEDNGKFILNQDLPFLRESLIETVGGDRV